MFSTSFHLLIFLAQLCGDHTVDTNGFSFWAGDFCVFYKKKTAKAC